MARGLSREQSLAKNMKKTAASNKGNQEDLSTTARAARDAAAMQEKAAAKAAAKEAAQIAHRRLSGQGLSPSADGVSPM